MGALHAGHLALIKASNAQNDVTIASIFVNPTQFNEASDLEKYPRTPDADCDVLRENGCDIVFMPTVDEVYPNGAVKSEVDYGLLTSSLEGALRKGHFDGVVQVVRRLLELVPCQNAYFGEKDFQQLAVIRHLVNSENIQTEIHGVPTIREANGLAMSSRNQLLNPQLNAAALALSEALQTCSQLTPESNLMELKREGLQMMKDAGARPEYFEIIDSATFEILQSVENQLDARAVAAAFVGDVRLIDNMAVNITEAKQISEPQAY